MTQSNRRAPLTMLLRWGRPQCQPVNGRLALRAAIGLLALIGFAILVQVPLPASAQADGPQVVPDVPDKPTATAIYEGMVDLEWNDVPGAASYDVQAFYSDWFDLPGNGVEIAFYGPGAIIKGLTPESRYYFRVRANNALGSSDWSDHRLVNPTGGDFGNWDGVPEPTNSRATGAPTISGVPNVGKTLMADISGIEDENGLDRVKFHYQWVSIDGTDEEDIEGGTDASYVLVAADEGRFIEVRVSFTDRGGYAESVPSAATEAVVVPPNIDATGAPTISGKPLVQETLTASTSDIQDENGLDGVKFSYQWIWNDGTSDTDDIQGATDSAYTLSDADEGKTISVRVSFTDRDGYRETLTSDATDEVESPPGPPLNLAVSNDENGQLELSWETPASDGGSAITRYHVQWKSGNEKYHPSREASVSVLSYTVRELTNGVEHSVQVVAVNEVGDGEAAEITATPRDTIPPELLTARVNGPTITLNYDEALDANSTPPTSAFSVLVGSTAREVSEVSISGSSVSFTLASAVTPDDTVALSYSAPQDTGEQRVQDTTGNNAPSFSEEPVANDTPTPNTRSTGAPTIDGYAQLGETLTADTSGIDDEDGLTNVVFSYQWIRNDGTNDADIDGANGATYTLVKADEGRTIKVTVSFTDAEGNSETLTSVATGVVANDTPTSTDGICGRTEQVRDEILRTVLQANSDNIIWELPAGSDCASVSESDLLTITWLGLSYEDITELQSGDFQGLSNLAYLGLSANDLTELPAGVFSGLSNLEELDLRSNELTGLPAGVFTGLSNLEELDLSLNELSELPAGVFTGLSNLEELNLSANELSELPRSIFDGLDNLKKLYLRVNPGVLFWYPGRGEELEDHSGIRFTDRHGDTPETATPLPYGALPNGYGASISGRIYPVTDVDYFELEVTDSNKGYVGIVVTQNAGTSGVRIAYPTLFDSEGNCVGPLCKYPDETSSSYKLEPGTYYLRVNNRYEKDFLDNFPDALEANASYSVRWYADSSYQDFLDRCSAIETDFDDPLYGCQSEFHDRGSDAEDINVEPVWAEGNLGEGIIVRIVDIGVDYEHEDLRDNFSMALSSAAHENVRIFSPNQYHGTAVAGILAASDNSVGGRGVAPRATIYSYSLGGHFGWSDVTKGVTHQLRDTAVSNHSHILRSRQEYPALVGSYGWEQAIEKGITRGFHGKGTSYVFGAGNGEVNANLSEVANFYGIINVCGIAYDGSPIHSYGSNVWICAPVNVLTTDNFDRYYRTWGGTSFATPVVSGVVALVRSENSSLTWRDVKLILAASARQTSPDAPEWETGALQFGSTDRRYTYHPRFAFGVVDAKAAVDLAKTWTNLPFMKTSSAESVGRLTIPDPAQGAEPDTVSRSLTLGPEIGFTEFVEVSVGFTHPSFRDLELEIVSPSGTVSMLTEHDAAVSDDEFLYLYRFGSAKHLGEDPTGTWTLRLTDHVPGHEGRIWRWNLKVYGHGAGTVQTALPTIIGTAQVGETLTADISGIADSDGLDNAVFSYQWVRNAGGADANIQGATGATYTLESDDEGNTLKVIVSFTDDANNEESLTSDPTGEVAAAPAQNIQATGVPTISGTVQVGETLTAETSGIADEDGLTNVVFSYLWMAGDTNIQDATDATYTLVSDDEGKTLKVIVSFTDDANNEESLTSEPTGPVVPDPGPLTVFTVVDTSSDTDTVLGTLEDGGALILGNPTGGEYGIRVDTDSNDDIHKVELALSGAKTEGKEEWVFPYSLYGDDGEHKLKGENLPAGAYELKATAYKQDGDVLGTLKVSFTVTAGQPAQQPAGVPTITGTLQVGQTLTVDTSGIADGDGLTNVVFSYQWMADDTNIQGATGSNYTLTVDDEGKAIRVQVSFTDDGNNEESLPSAATDAVAPDPGTLTGFALLDASDQTVVATLSEGDEVGLPDPADGIYTIRADAELGATIGSVKLELTGAKDVSRTEDAAPYSLYGDGADGLHGEVLPVGAYTLRATAYSERDGGGDVLETDAISFTVNSPTTGEPAITGQPRVGKTLTANTSQIADKDGLTHATFSYRWVRNDGNVDTEIGEANGSTYTLTEDDEGKTVKVTVSLTDDGGTRESATSAPTSRVKAEGDRPTLNGTTVYLTFDDGPHPVYTPQILDVLESYDAKAMFFVTGVNVDLYPEIIARMAADGHGIGNHTWGHERLPDLTEEEFTETITRTQNAIGETASPCLRPPYGAITSVERGLAESLGFQVVMWTLPNPAWDGTWVDSFVSHIVPNLRDGSIVLMHDGDGHGKAILALNKILEQGTNKGYRFEPVCQLPELGEGENHQNNTATGLRTITGAAQVGETLTVDTSGIVDADGLTSPAFSYQWVADDEDIAGATGSSYTLTEDDEGKAITVRVSFTDDANNEESLTSEPTGPVVPDPGPLTVFKVVDTSSNPDTVLGTLEDGGTLTLEDPASGSYGIRVDTDSGHDDHGHIHKVELALSGAKTEGKEEWVFPYSLYGDDGEHKLKGENLPAGAYDLRATAYDDDGDVLGTLKVSFSVAYAAPAEEQPPTQNTNATGAPTISGAARVGQTLTADTSGIADEDGLSDAVFSYQWLADDTNIQGATGSNYTLTVDDEGKSIRVTVSFTDAEGNPETLTSDPTGEVAPKPNTQATGQPSISGTVRVGQTLTADVTGIADEDGLDNVTFSYQWLADDTNIQGATDLTYTLTEDDEGKAITVTVNFTDAEDNEESLTSDPTGAVEPAPNSEATGALTITGTAQVGERLTADVTGIADADGLDNVAFSYQWIAGGSDIEGATGSSCELTSSEQGQTITVEVSFTDDRNNAETLTSAATDAVAAKPNTQATGLPTITGTVQVGETLTADTSGIADEDRLDNVTFSYQWMADDANIQGATDRTYTLADRDEGKAITVTVSFTDDANNEESLTSAATDAVTARPGKPQSLAGEAMAQEIKLTWKAPSGSVVTHYVVYRGTLQNGSMNGQALSKYATIEATDVAMAYTDDNVEKGVEYRYRVAAVNSDGEGKKSTWLDITAEEPSP